MALSLYPPTHRVDQLGIFVDLGDPAFDEDLYDADMLALLDSALNEVRDQAEAEFRAKNQGRVIADEEIVALRESCVLTLEQAHKARAKHPLIAYASGRTRFAIDCETWDPSGKPCTVRSRYLTKGPASEFTIGRLSRPDYLATDSIVNSNERLTEFCRLGLKAIKSPNWNWRVKAGETADESILQALFDADPSLPITIGTAVVKMCAKLNEIESFRT